jgi:hypothetical protein
MSINAHGILERTGDWLGISGATADAKGSATRTADQWNPEYSTYWTSGQQSIVDFFTPATSQTGYVHAVMKYYDGAATTYRFKVYSYNKTGASSITLVEVDDFGDATRDFEVQNNSGTITIVYTGAILSGSQRVDIVARSERGFSI